MRSQLSAHLSNVLGVWANEPEEIRDGLKALRRSLFSPLAHKLGWEFAENEDYKTSLMRVLAIANAGKSKDTQTIEEAKKRFWAFVEGDLSALHPNLRGSVYSIVLTAAEDDSTEEKKVWESILKIYNDESLPIDQRMIALNALGGAKSSELVERFLHMSLDEKQIRGQDSLYVFRS